MAEVLLPIVGNMSLERDDAFHPHARIALPGHRRRHPHLHQHACPAHTNTTHLFLEIPTLILLVY